MWGTIVASIHHFILHSSNVRPILSLPPNFQKPPFRTLSTCVIQVRYMKQSRPPPRTEQWNRGSCPVLSNNDSRTHLQNHSQVFFVKGHVHEPVQTKGRVRAVHAIVEVAQEKHILPSLAITEVIKLGIQLVMCSCWPTPSLSAKKARACVC